MQQPCLFSLVFLEGKPCSGPFDMRSWGGNEDGPAIEGIATAPAMRSSGVRWLITVQACLASLPGKTWRAVTAAILLDILILAYSCIIYHIVIIVVNS